ncbi:unnamed protein product, partial [Rotaria magnacalcarata]
MAIGILIICVAAPKQSVPKCDINFTPRIPDLIHYEYGPRSLAIGDFNDDNWPDIVVANYAADNIAIYFGYGNGSMKSSNTYSTGSGSTPCMVAVGDFDKDGRLDVAVSNFGTNSVNVLMRFQYEVFANQTTLSIASSRPIWIHVTYLNNDTAIDIVTANYGTQSVSIFYGHGDGSFAKPSTYSTGFDSFPLAVVSGDFNNDNQMDLAIANYGTNTVGILLGNSNGTFSKQSTLSTGPNS